MIHFVIAVVMVLEIGRFRGGWANNAMYILFLLCEIGEDTLWKGVCCGEETLKCAP